MRVEPIQPPQSIWVWRELLGEGRPLEEDDSVEVSLSESVDGTAITVRSDGLLSRVALRWDRPEPRRLSVLGDAWERSYGDLHWGSVRPDRPLPWYWAAVADDGSTTGAGVRVRAGAMASWTVDDRGFSLWLDLRSGTQPVRLKGRSLSAATVVELTADASVPSFFALKALVDALGSDPLLPGRAIFGSNNWYYAYGEGFDANAVARDAALVSDLTGDGEVRPYSVIDAGWSEGGSAPGGPWNSGWQSFADMSAVAARIENEGAVPGLWFRPLLTRQPTSSSHSIGVDGGYPLDPSLPETLEQVAADLGRFRRWGYGLVKHDFTTFDVLGAFLPGEIELPRHTPWTFADSSRTTAEILVALYRTIAEAAEGMIVLGCNTVGHLAAGFEHVHRIGDDTSGRIWDRTRRMGVNALAFRLPQHGSFFVADADCVPATPATPWEKNRQFLDLVARTGTALFVSVDPASRTRDVDRDIRNGIQRLLHGGGSALPLDWTNTSSPARWREGGETLRYDFLDPWGADPLLKV